MLLVDRKCIKHIGQNTGQIISIRKTSISNLLFLKGFLGVSSFSRTSNNLSQSDLLPEKSVMDFIIASIFPLKLDI